MAISGVAGAEYGIRGWIAATDLNTQKEVWRTYTIPGKGEPGSATWKDAQNASASGGVVTSARKYRKVALSIPESQSSPPIGLIFAA